MSQIDDYLDTVTTDQREALEHLISVVRDVVPDVEDGWSYAMPTLKYKNKGLVGFLAWPHHIGFYPFGNAPIEAVKDKLADYRTSKGAVQFTLEKPLPDAVLREMIVTRAQIIEQEATKK